jgi:HD-GYP domain-containing protein (c-di-GMP phosphodiesterase class II)
MSDDKLERLERIASKKHCACNEEMPGITEDEFRNLSVRKGSLTEEDRKIIENHATMTLKILEQLPFPKKLSHVPEYAGSHHEKLDGSGYPRHLTEKDLPLQSRIMALADVFEALTAKDRPYKKPMSLSQALRILDKMKEDKHIDADIYELFCSEKLYLTYAHEEMNAEQIDLP